MSKSKVRPELALMIAVGAGLVIGFLIKRFRIGLIFGVFISLLYVLIASARKRK